MRSQSLIAVCMVFLAACGEGPVQEPPQSDSPEKVDSVIPTAPAPESQQPAAHNPFPALDVQAAWKAELESDCAQDTPAATLASFDMTGDGKPERICWRVFKAEPVGEYVDVVVVREGARRQSAYILLPADGSVQEAVCPSDNYAIRPDEWTNASRREAYGIPEDWPKVGLTISNDCDPVHLFWPNDADSGPDNWVRFYFARM
jgi:hypothetical protein